MFSGESRRNWPPAASGEIELPAGIRPAGEPGLQAGAQPVHPSAGMSDSA